MPARESLENALKEYGGTLLFVSHDRYFLNAVAERTVEIENCALNAFDGGYEAFNAFKKRQREEKAREEEREKLAKTSAAKEAGYRSKKERAEDERRKKLVKETESKICSLEDEENELNAALADPETACD